MKRNEENNKNVSFDLDFDGFGSDFFGLPTNTQPVRGQMKDESELVAIS